MYELVKVLSLLVYPLGFCLVLLAVALVFHLRGRHRTGNGLAGLSIGLLWLFSMPAVGDGLIRQIESGWAFEPVDALPSADAVVVLGGAFSSGRGEWPYPDAGGNVDRYWHAARIFRAGKAPVVILSGGRAPSRREGWTEAESGAIFLVDMGVPRSAIVLDTEALTTRDNAVNVNRIVTERGFGSILLVTSASHMRRSLVAFSRVQAKVIPVATDFSTTQNPPFTLRRILPSVSALGRSTRAIHELVGLAYYRLRGWD